MTSADHPRIRLRCLIVDDEPNAVNLLEIFIQQNTSWDLLAKCYDAREALAFLHQTHQIGGRRHIGDPPAPGLLAERQLEALAAQPALVDDREVTPGRLGELEIRAWRKIRRGLMARS